MMRVGARTSHGVGAGADGGAFTWGLATAEESDNEKQSL